MIHIYKIYWALRSLLLKPFFGKYGLMSYMGKPIFLMGLKNFYFGKRTRIFPGARLESHNGGIIEIQDNVSIGQNFHCISGENQKLVISKNTTISANVFISNIDHDYREIGKHILEQNIIKKETTIGENSFIGFGAVILPGSKLGKQCIVGANSVVRGEYPDFSVLVGSPAKIVKKYNFDLNIWEKNNEYN